MKYLKNSRGLTLVEVIAVIVIASIVALLVFGIIKSSTDQKVEQLEDAQDLFDITYALKVVTKDIRRSVDATTTTTQQELKLKFPDTTSITYKVIDGKLKKINDNSGNEEIITSGIGCAQFTTENVNTIKIELSNTNNCSEGKNTYIHLRKGS